MTMETRSNREGFEIQFSRTERQVLDRTIKFLQPFVKLPKLDRYASMSADDVWLALVTQVCVSGSALRFERLVRDGGKHDIFKRTIGTRRRPAAYHGGALFTFTDRSAHGTLCVRLLRYASADQGAVGESWAYARTEVPARTIDNPDRPLCRRHNKGRTPCGN